MNELERFNKLARKASFHYADDSCKEWHLASDAKQEALKIFDESPNLHQTIRENFNELWSLKRERPDD